MEETRDPIYVQPITNKLYMKQRLYRLKMQEGSNLAQHVNIFNQIITDLAHLDVDEITAALLAHNQRKQNAGESSHDDSLYVKGNQDRGRKLENEGFGKRNSRSKSRGKKMIHCYKCKESGHMKRDFPKLKKQVGEKRYDSSKSANVVRNDNSDCSDGDMLSISTNQCVDAWIIDSGCSYHITPNREWFTSYRESSLDGSMYYVTFTDNFSRKVWVYFLKQKSEVFTKFKLWKVEVENQTGRTIKYLRSNNGTKYTDTKKRLSRDETSDGVSDKILSLISVQTKFPTVFGPMQDRLKKTL
ncbi:Retrovirus-related Pol polyprotein from transposon TNT 1-94 [Sesamum angolense]|uniref:Retrovirus-related Pol polyprotein from transposon TNT 1-94 n=1 Tax=Sesamum angolense TaxID=2727404 RepID=A0AAE1VZD1_9LAMI|nr:Retrovirus-related Pol polyprotein from transposon TNT 1-94 [Sesamum angolense]